ncbi:MAG: hypothetical protein Q7R63_00115, partial [bacterium]|nr:hypothetical protein [bacterium]
TGRPHGLQEITDESLERNFEGCFVEIYHTDAFGIGGGVPVPKVDICQKIGARTIIEDCLIHAVPCADAGMDVILLDQPWNRGATVLADGIVRVHSWEGILSRLL